MTLTLSLVGYTKEPASLNFHCSSKDFVDYEIEMLLEDFYDPQFDTETREQIIEEYDYYVSQSDMLAEACH